jgi:hypothetical protein
MQVEDEALETTEQTEVEHFGPDRGCRTGLPHIDCGDSALARQWQSSTRGRHRRPVTAVVPERDA